MIDDLVRELEALLLEVGQAHERPALASSLSAEDMLLTDAIARCRAAIGVFVIDTGRLHAETLALLDTARRLYPLPFEVFKPQEGEVLDYVQRNGLNAFYDSVELRQRCCAIRKVEPLQRALTGRTAWITGQRRVQGADRARLQEREHDSARSIAKFNPLAAWADDDVREYVALYQVPVNPLHARGYPSIGCEPCTRASRPGEDARAGRWWWEQNAAKECGLHLHVASPGTETLAARELAQ